MLDVAVSVEYIDNGFVFKEFIVSLVDRWAFICK